MNFTNQKQERETTDLNSQELRTKLDQLIANAIEKVGGRKENDLCKYLPVPTGGYMHHFTLRKMKTEQPEQLFGLIEKFILKVEQPDRVTPKPRAARGSRKRRDQINLTKSDLERMLNIARIAGDKEMIAKLTPKKSLPQIKKDLISSIRQGRAEQELWNSYVETLHNQHQLSDLAAGTEDLSMMKNSMNNPAGLGIGLNS